MFALSSSAKEGQCPARRCAKASIDHPENPFKLCGKHFGEWLGEGKPELESAAPKPAKTKSGTAIVSEASPELLDHLEKQRAEARKALDMCKGMVITNQAQMDAAGRLMAELKRRRRALEADKEFNLAPLNEHVKRMRQHFNGPIEFYESCERAVKAAVGCFLKEQQAAQVAALAEVESASKALVSNTEDTIPAEVLAVAHGVENVQKPEGIATSKVWKVKSVDPEQLPREYMIPDMKRIAAEVKALGKAFNVPGVEIEQDIAIINRT